MLITKLLQSKNQNLVQIFIDDDYAASINKNTLVKFKLYQGLELSQELWQEILNKDLFIRFFNAALKQIAFRPRSQREIKQFLKKKIFKYLPDEDSQHKMLNNVIEKLLKEKYLDDFEFAKWLVDNRLAFKGKSRAELEIELYTKGIAKEVINEVLLAEDFTSIEIALIQKDALKKFHITTMPEDKKLALKITSYFQRRGFGYDKIKEALINNG